MNLDASTDVRDLVQERVVATRAIENFVELHVGAAVCLHLRRVYKGLALLVNAR